MKTRTKLDDLILDHGSCYNGGDGLTIGSYYALDFVKHYGRVQTGSNISVAMHSYQAAMIGAKWWSWNEQGLEWGMTQHEFTTHCLFHDACEAIVGDVWRPVKTKEVKAQEDLVQGHIMKFLEMPADLSPEIHKEITCVDNCAQFCELVRYLEISPGHLVFTAIGASQARILIAAGMYDFCLDSLGLGKHPVAAKLLSEAHTSISTEGTNG